MIRQVDKQPSFVLSNIRVHEFIITMSEWQLGRLQKPLNWNLKSLCFTSDTVINYKYKVRPPSYKLIYNSINYKLRKMA